MERLLVGLTVLVVAAVLADWNAILDRPTNGDSVCVGRNTAWTMAKVIVRQNLGALWWPDSRTAKRPATSTA